MEEELVPPPQNPCHPPLDRHPLPLVTVHGWAQCNEIRPELESLIWEVWGKLQHLKDLFCSSLRCRDVGLSCHPISQLLDHYSCPNLCHKTIKIFNIIQTFFIMN